MGRVSLCLSALALVSLPAELAADSTLAVTSTAAFSGNFGLEVGVTTCSVAQDLTLEPPLTTVTGLYEACGTLLARGVEVGLPGATFRSGGRVVLGDGFKVPAGSTFNAIIGRALSPYAWVESLSPASESGYLASFYLRLDDMMFADGEELDHLVGYMDGGSSVFRVVLKRNLALGENRLTLAARLDDGTEVTTPLGEENLVPDGWNEVEIDWAAGQGTGHFLVSINGGPLLGLTGLDNLSRRLDSIRWGSVGGNLISSSGLMQMDEFSSSRTGTGGVNLMWDPNQEPDLAGYVLHYGTQSGIYTVEIDVGNTTSYTVTDLQIGQTYFFVLTAYDQGQNESAFSSEISVTIDGVIFEDGFESGTLDSWD